MVDVFPWPDCPIIDILSFLFIIKLFILISKFDLGYLISILDSLISLKVFISFLSSIFLNIALSL